MYSTALIILSADDVVKIIEDGRVNFIHLEIWNWWIFLIIC